MMMPDETHVFTRTGTLGDMTMFTAHDDADAEMFIRSSLGLDMDGYTLDRMRDDAVLRIGIGEPGDELKRGDKGAEGASFDEHGRAYIEQTAREWAAEGPHRVIGETEG